MRLPVQIAEWACRGVGMFSVDVGVQASNAGSYRPPVLNDEPFVLEPPPHTIIKPPVQTAVWDVRPVGAFVSERGDQLSDAGS
jgi:hypothetical protein